MKRIILNALIILIFIFATGCTSNADTVDTPLYSGKSLFIGVVGEVPKIREEHVHFTSISCMRTSLIRVLVCMLLAIFKLVKPLNFGDTVFTTAK
jgi:hypothetical protein